MTIAEDDRIFTVDIEPYIMAKADGSPYPLGSTILTSIDGVQIDWHPSIGPYDRTETQAEHLILFAGARDGERLSLP